RQETWPSFVGLVLIEPDDDVLPTRATYDGTGFGIGSSRLARSTEPLWYATPDAVAARVITGRSPKIVGALRFVARGRARGLRPRPLSVGGRSRAAGRVLLLAAGGTDRKRRQTDAGPARTPDQRCRRQLRQLRHGRDGDCRDRAGWLRFHQRRT